MSTENSQKNVTDEIILRMREAVGVDSDLALGEKLGSKSRGYVSNWRKVNSVPDGALAKVSQITGMSVVWLKTGQGDMRPGTVGETFERYTTEPVEDWRKTGALPSDFEMETLDMLRSLEEKERRRIVRFIRNAYLDKAEA